MMTRICGPCLALLAFSVSILRGMTVGNPTDVVLARALWALLVFLIVGSAIGWLSQAVIREDAKLRENREAAAREEKAEAEAELAAQAAADTEASAANADAVANIVSDVGKQNSAPIPEGAGLAAG